MVAAEGTLLRRGVNRYKLKTDDVRVQDWVSDLLPLGPHDEDMFTAKTRTGVVALHARDTHLGEQANLRLCVAEDEFAVAPTSTFCNGFAFQHDRVSHLDHTAAPSQGSRMDLVQVEDVVLTLVEVALSEALPDALVHRTLIAGAL